MNVSQAIATINLYVYSDAGVTREMAGDAVDVLMLAVESLNAERNELRAERDALAAELATVREAANVEWQEEHAARLVAEERLKAAEQRETALQEMIADYIRAESTADADARYDAIYRA